MPSNPTTKSQVQAYQFVLRRMQSALVRRDAVMLHDPMRTHTRATVVGAILGIVGLAGFAIWGLISPEPKPPGEGIVIAEQSGTIYVKTSDPTMLIPTFNLASARLMIMARSEQGQAGGAQPSGGQVQVAEATVVPDEKLVGIPRGRWQGIPFGPPLLPTTEQRISDHWAVCEEIKTDPSLPDQVALDRATSETTVLAGVQDLGRELAVDESLLVTAENGKSYLIYRSPSDPNRPNADAVRAEVDLSDGAVRSALRLPEKGRPISIGLLNAIPPVGELKPPVVSGADTASQFDLGGMRVGAVFSTPRAGPVPDYWAITRSGIQNVSRAVADLILYNRSPEGGEIPSLSPDKVQNVPRVRPGSPDYLPVDDYPEVVPTVLDPLKTSVACLGWTLEGEGDNREGHTAVYVGAEVPLPRDEQGNRHEAVGISSPSPDGLKIDKFFMPPGHGAVVRAATSKESFDKGPIYLISDLGVRYGIPNAATAAGLGLAEQRPAPDSIVRLLPTGPELNTRAVQRTFDSGRIASEAGTFLTQRGQGGQAGGPGG